MEAQNIYTFDFILFFKKSGQTVTPHMNASIL